MKNHFQSILTACVTTAAATLIVSAMAVLFIPLSYMGHFTLLFISGIVLLVASQALAFYFAYVRRQAKARRRALRNQKYNIFVVPNNR